MPATISSPHTITLFTEDSCTMTVKAETKTDIEDRFIPDAIAKGCQFYSALKDAPPDREFVELPEALALLVEKGDPKDFSPLTGVPKVAAVADLVGEKVPARQIVAAWEEQGFPTKAKKAAEDE